jgi:phenolic acid decarboxylase
MDQKIIEALPTTIILFDERTGEDITFQLDKEKIKYFHEIYIPKWKENKQYFLICQKFWGIHQQRLLYVDSTGLDFFVDYYH